MSSSAVSPSSVNRLDHRLAWGRPLLTCYYPVGDPDIPPRLLDIYAECGVDIVELGLPTRDPFMDGADVASSMARALAAGDIPARFRQAAARLQAHPDAPASICMTYADADLERVGGDVWQDIDGLLMLGLDSRPDSRKVKDWALRHGLRSVKFINDGLDPSYLAAAREADAYIMLQAAAGSTGPRSSLLPNNRVKIKKLRALGFNQPILLGFGISSAEQARAAVELGADGVIIGSMTIRVALQGEAALRSFLNEVKAALDG